MKPLSLTEQTHRFDPSNIGANAPRGFEPPLLHSAHGNARDENRYQRRGEPE